MPANRRYNPTVTRGKVEFFEQGLPAGSEFLLLGSAEEGGELQVIDDARTFAEAKTKAEMFLQDHPNGGILIEKHMCAVYRLPVFDKKES